MAKRKAANANGGVVKGAVDQNASAIASAKPVVDSTDASGDTTSRVDILAASAAITEREPVKVNNMNAVELKNACDDAVKRLLSQPNLFKEKHTHTDVKLLLGWASVLIAVGTAAYGWKVDFEQSKPVVWIGVILYALLTSASTLYSFLIEKDSVFVGRRRTLAKRVETEHITVASRTLPPVTLGTSPRYRASVSYVRSSNSGKSLLRRGQATEEHAYTEFFDEEGTMDQEGFERWLGALVERVMEGR
ncbi:SPC2 [Sanghuangporus weigelae]